ncbi:related to F-box protein MET30 [Saccharomycodes ludwigii]|uniref:Related to F-box protein MET30 n=1 Tax=Saccharomycodes ludwigii TaxID=36035 RepID=A0A376B8W8_9ASCO|nr:hypothetical protein SCDLUD_000358 [Saccharomycodes ludwigii]KAH3902769.1 hypothetical protein SCDLUD_000358 [Saccharomycodes ludwigii]SSD61143.1 related to F-box protein MET30 [Saccharomycodes ludwigii]
MNISDLIQQQSQNRKNNYQHKNGNNNKTGNPIPISTVLKMKENNSSNDINKKRTIETINTPSSMVTKSQIIQEEKRICTRSPPQYSFTRYCYRHNPDYHKNVKLDGTSSSSSDSNTPEPNLLQQICGEDGDFQKKLDLYCPSTKDQQDIQKILTIFNNSGNTPMKKELILHALLNLCCSPQLSFISQQVTSMIKIDFVSDLPQELSLKILSYLDCSSLCEASKVNKKWNLLADDDRVWYHMCEQHIDRKCPHCGWGLPLLHMKTRRFVDIAGPKPFCESSLNSTATLTYDNNSNITFNNHNSKNSGNKNLLRNNKAANTVGNNNTASILASGGSVSSGCSNNNSNAVIRKTRPWKVVYKERFNVERNWRRGNCRIQEFKGHMDGVLDCKFNYACLFTASYDSTVAMWDINNGKLLRRFTGHSNGVKTLLFDESKLITGSLDKTIRVWNYHTGECISTYRGHTDSVLSIDAYKKIIVSSSADTTVKVWHVESRTCFTLRGHENWVNCVKLHPASFTCYSCSDDMTIRMWDIRTNTCLKIFKGHVGQVQKVIPLTIIDEENLVADVPYDKNYKDDVNLPNNKTLTYPTHLLSCSLDNTIKLWHIQTGICVRTHFGHAEGVWDIACDNFRIISGSHDTTVKVWDLQSGKMIYSFDNAHDAPVTCVAIGDSEFVSGDESGKVCMFHFDI